MNFLDVLAKKNIISLKDIPALSDRATDAGISLEEFLIRRGVDPAVILSAKGEALGIPTKSLENEDVPYSVLEYVPEESAVHYKFVPIGLKDHVLEVGVVDPDNMEARDALNFISSKTGLPYKIFLISNQDFEKVLTTYKGLSGEVTEALSELETEFMKDGNESSASQGPDGTKKEGSEAKIVEDAPVTKIVETILHYATEGNASDIHIERMRDNVRVRFRVDGTLNISLVLPASVHSALTARIKILSNMRLDEKRKPQDGRFRPKSRSTRSISASQHFRHTMAKRS